MSRPTRRRLGFDIAAGNRKTNKRRAPSGSCKGRLCRRHWQQVAIESMASGRRPSLWRPKVVSRALRWTLSVELQSRAARSGPLVGRRKKCRAGWPAGQLAPLATTLHADGAELGECQSELAPSATSGSSFNCVNPSSGSGQQQVAGLQRCRRGEGSNH